MVGDGVLAGGNGLEQRRLSAAVLAQQAVAAAKGQLEGGVGDEDAAVEDEGAAGDLDVLALLGGGQHAGGDAVRDAVLVHLVGQALDLVQLVIGGGGPVGVLDGVSVDVELGLLLARLADDLLAAGSGLLGLLGESLLLGG